MYGNPKIGIREIVACGIRNAGIWNPEFCSSNRSEITRTIGNAIQALRAQSSGKIAVSLCANFPLYTQQPITKEI